MNCSGQVENSLELALVSHAETEHQHLHLRPLHDKATLIAFASLAAWSWFVYSFGASLGILREEQGTSPMIGGLHGTALAVGGILGALATPRLNQKFGRGLVMRISTAGVVVGILIFTIPGVTVVGTLVGAFIACFFGNPIVVCVNSFIVTHQGPASAPALTESTALAALMGVLAPVFLGISIASVLGWRAGSWAAVIAFVFIEIWRGRNLAVFGAPGEVRTRKESGALPRLTYWALTANMCYIGAEFCMSLWGVDLLREQVGLSAAGAAAGLGALTAGIFVGRAFGAGITRAVPAERLLKVSAIIGIVAFMIMWLATSAPVMLAAFFVTGVGVSLQWPLGMARILRSAGGRTDRAAGAALAFGTAAIGGAPFVLGAMAERMPIHQAFLIVPVLLAASLGIVIFRPVPEAAVESAAPAQAPAVST